MAKEASNGGKFNERFSNIFFSKLVYFGINWMKDGILDRFCIDWKR